MVLESNRDLVLRRLTEALARDRTRHQVSEVTSLGLVQMTRKKLGTGLVEAFSTTCSHCSGRGIMLHADPVDTAAAAGRKAEPGSRRSKRGKKARTDEPAVARVPAHVPGEHPMFKAMAAANGRPEDEDSEEELADELDREAIAEADTEEQVAEEIVDEDLEDEDFDDSEDEDDSDDEDEDEDEDEIDVDLDEDDEDLDEDTIDIDAEDSDEDDSDDEDEYDDVDEPVAPPAPVSAGRTRRRAAARPAGPPVA